MNSTKWCLIFNYLLTQKQEKLHAIIPACMSSTNTIMHSVPILRLACCVDVVVSAIVWPRFKIGDYILCTNVPKVCIRIWSQVFILFIRKAKVLSFCADGCQKKKSFSENCSTHFVCSAPISRLHSYPTSHEHQWRVAHSQDAVEALCGHSARVVS